MRMSLLVKRTYIYGSVFRESARFVEVLLQIGHRFDQPPNRPDDDPENVTSGAEVGCATTRHVRGVEDDDWEGDYPNPDDLAYGRTCDEKAVRSSLYRPAD